MTMPTETQRLIARRLATAANDALIDALFAIAESATDPDSSGNDTAEVAYRELGKLGINVP
jgi:hypothetical protein